MKYLSRYTGIVFSANNLANSILEVREEPAYDIAYAGKTVVLSGYDLAHSGPS